ncbi:MAG: hypothetical protein N2504_05450 [candidate division WOR-3 bacterium]|nr:hypothetical protein [candidate division WOR-3 bacterium]MCX7948015.1 hypothetical protein [candidate division WOR-3 bacterium]MDW8151087.1 hypothetical protein [candidate division WOR-3 bacterium]
MPLFIILFSCSKKETIPEKTYDLKKEEYYYNIKTRSYTNNPNEEWHIKFIATNLEVDFDLGSGIVIGTVPNPTILLNNNISASLDNLNYKYDEYKRAINQIQLDSIYIFKTRNRKFIKVKFLSISDSIRLSIDNQNITFPIGSYINLEEKGYKLQSVYRDTSWDIYIGGINDIRLNISAYGKYPVKVGKDTIDVYVPERLSSGIDIFRLKSENDDGDSFRTDYYESIIGENWWEDYNLNVHTFTPKGIVYYIKLSNNSVYKLKVLEYNRGFIRVEVVE